MEQCREVWAADFGRDTVFLLQEVPEQWENSTLGCMQAAVARRGRTRRRAAVVFDERVWRLERHTEGEDWWQGVLRHRETSAAVEVVSAHLPHRQYDLQAYVRPLVEVGEPSVNRRVLGGNFNEDGWRASWPIGAWHICRRRFLRNGRMGSGAEASAVGWTTSWATACVL